MKKSPSWVTLSPFFCGKPKPLPTRLHVVPYDFLYQIGSAFIIPFHRYCLFVVIFALGFLVTNGAYPDYKKWGVKYQAAFCCFSMHLILSNLANFLHSSLKFADYKRTVSYLTCNGHRIGHEIQLKAKN